MHTSLVPLLTETPAGREAQSIIRRCVHCGFCNATCPTYQLVGDELDGPRGRIYLIKQVLEGKAASNKTQQHLDRCLTCRACETTCPSGVQYGRLVEIGRELVHRQASRPLFEGLKRRVLRASLPRRWLFSAALALGRWVRPLAPAALAPMIPLARPAGDWPATRHSRRMLTLAGCVQPGLAPDINAATARVLDRLGISLIEAPRAGCCGAVRGHLDAIEGARDDARRNIDAWWPLIEDGVEAIVMTASGCGAFVREYEHLLQHDAGYAQKAARVAAMSRDLSEILADESAALAKVITARPTEEHVAFHAPCTLQHAQKIVGKVESVLVNAGYSVVPVKDSHLCCGSAGTYSILQPEISSQLRDNKLAALNELAPDHLATANIGCLMHLQSASDKPVNHWISLVEARLA